MSDEHVRQRAYELWERSGGGHGRHDEHWSQALREIAAEMAAQDTGAAESGAAKKKTVVGRGATAAGDSGPAAPKARLKKAPAAATADGSDRPKRKAPTGSKAPRGT